jgi:hypothetical protein
VFEDHVIAGVLQSYCPYEDRIMTGLVHESAERW